MGDADDDVVGAFFDAVGLKEDFHVIVGAGDAGEERGVLLVEIGESVEGPAVGDVVALAGVAEAEGEIDAGELAGEIGVPGFAAILKRSEADLVAALRGGFAGRRSTGDGVNGAGDTSVIIGADVVLDEGGLSFDGHAATGFAVVGVFIGDGILGSRATGREDDESGGEEQGGRRARYHRLHDLSLAAPETLTRPSINRNNEAWSPGSGLLFGNFDGGNAEHGGERRTRGRGVERELLDTDIRGARLKVEVEFFQRLPIDFGDGDLE